MLNKLQQIIEAVNAADTLVEALQTVVKRVKQEIATDACSIYLYEKNLNAFQLLASVGFKVGVDGKIVIRPEEGLVGLVAKREEPINLENAQEHSRYRYFPETGEEQYQAFLGAPIIHQRKVLGVFVAQQVEKRRFDESEEALLVTVSAQLAAVIAHAEASGKYPFHETETKDLHPEMSFNGIAAAPGVAIGEAFVIYPPADIESVPTKQTDDISKEQASFAQALSLARSELAKITEKMSRYLPKEEVAIFDAYQHILDDTGLAGEIKAKIDEGYWAQTAVKKVIKKHVYAFSEMEDDYLRERVVDIKDLGRRLLKHLQQESSTKRHFPENCILVGEEISASQLAEAPKKKLAAIVTLTGSKNSHVAILARALGIPVVTSAQGVALDEVDGQKMILDGYNGRGIVSPNQNILTEYEKLADEERELYAGLYELIDKPATTPDGHTISLNVNTGLIAETPTSLELGAEGVGLYRTEIPFLLRDRFPSEDEQAFLYGQVLKSFHPRPVTMRTLDIGGDKTLPYFPIKEENPFLGWRGIRVTLDHPEIFLQQVRAMLQANVAHENLRIMLPMISEIAEVREAKKFIQQAHDELTEELGALPYPQIGAMIETPAAVYQADLIAREVDFLSVGTNDLAQYLLAVDRNNSRVAYLYNMLNPAVLLALESIVASARRNNVPVTVCGEMTTDPVSAVLLLGMNFDGLSMTPSGLLPIKWVIRSISFEKAQALWQRVRTFETADQIRAVVSNEIEAAGLGGLIRAGK